MNLGDGFGFALGAIGAGLFVAGALVVGILFWIF